MVPPPFRINVDGLIGTNFNDLEIEQRDSLYVFVEVTLDINNQIATCGGRFDSI